MGKMSDEPLARGREPIERVRARLEALVMANAAPRCGSIQADRQALPSGSHAERPVQASWWQEHGAAHAGGPRAQQAGKLETRALFAGGQGGTVAPAGGTTCAPRSVRLDLKAPAIPRCKAERSRLRAAILALRD